MPKYLTNTTFFSDNLGSLIQNGIVQTKKVVVNGDLELSGSITNGLNTISFADETINILKDIHIYGVGYIDLSGSSYNIAELLAQYAAGIGIPAYPSISYDGDTLTTSIIYSIDLSGASSILFPSTQEFSSLKLSDNLVLNDDTSISQSQLTLIPDIATNTTDIDNLKLKTTNISFAGTTTSFGGSCTFTNAPNMSGANISDGTIPIAKIQGVAVNLNSNQVITGIKQHTVNIRLDASLLCGTSGGTTILNSTLTKINFLSNVSSDIANDITTNSNNITTNTNNITTNTNNITTNTNNITTNTNSINSIKTKLTDVSYASSNTVIANTLNLTNMVFTGTLNNFTKIDFNNVITQCTSLNSNCQNQINNAVNKANSAQNKADSADEKAVNASNKADSALTLAGIANGAAGGAAAVAAGAATIAAGAVSVNTTQQTEIDDLQVDVAALQVKTTQISYNAATSRTTVSQTLNASLLEIGELTSGFTQTVNQGIKLEGILTCKRAVNIEGTLYLENNNSMIIEGIINQNNAAPPNNAENQFLAPTNILGTLTVSGNQSNSGNFTTSGAQTSLNSTNTQIGTTTASTLTINSNTTCNGDITMLTNKNLRLKSIVPILLDDIMFGDAAGTYNNYDIIFNMELVANRPLTLNANFTQGTNEVRKTYLGYNDTYTTYASTSATISSPSLNLTGTNTTLTTTATNTITGVTNNLTSTGTTTISGLTVNVDGTFVNIGNVLSTNILYGSTYIQSLYSPGGVINAVGVAMQQFV